MHHLDFFLESFEASGVGLLLKSSISDRETSTFLCVKFIISVIETCHVC